MVSIDARRREVKVNGEFIHLTTKEFDVLNMLKKADGRVLSRKNILATCWGHRFVKWNHRIIDTHVGRIRRRLKKFKAEGQIVTVAKEGMIFHLSAPDPNTGCKYTLSRGNCRKCRAAERVPGAVKENDHRLSGTCAFAGINTITRVRANRGRVDFNKPVTSANTPGIKLHVETIRGLIVLND